MIESIGGEAHHAYRLGRGEFGVSILDRFNLERVRLARRATAGTKLVAPLDPTPSIFTAAATVQGLEATVRAQEVEIARLVRELTEALEERDEAREEFRATIVSLGDTQESLSACRALAKKLGQDGASS